MVPILDLEIGKTFSNFEEIETLMTRLKNEFFYPLKFSDSQTIQTYNKTVKSASKICDEKWRYKNATIVCCHHGKHRDRGTGKRPNQNVFACECPFFFRVVYQQCLEKFTITSLFLEHKNHPISSEDIKTYRKDKNLNPEASTFTKTALLTGAQPHHIRKNIMLEFGEALSTKDIQNMKCKLQGIKQDDWHHTAELLNVYAKDQRNLVKVFHDDDNNINLICVQLSKQKELYRLYGQTLELDGTYCTNVQGMPLYTLLIEDNHGIGQPIYYAWMKQETTDFITLALRTFAENNDVSVTNVILTDKDCAELAGIKTVFPNATSLLCQFHVDCAVDTRLNKAKLETNHQEEIYQSFQRAMHAESEEQIKKEEQYLCNIEEDNLGDYFKKQWFNIRNVWCDFYRTTLFTKGNKTTNRLERFHSTIKKTINHRQVKFHQIVQVLLDISTLRTMDSDRKAREARVKFPTSKPHPLLKAFSEVITPYALKLIQAEIAMNKTSSYGIFKSADVYRVTSNKGENEIKGNLQSCTCHFFMSYGLPCSHIVYVATEMEICLPQQSFNSCWKVEKIPSQEAYQIEEPTNDSITVKMKRTKAKSFTREQLWVEANELAKEWANTLTNLPIPAFQGQLNAMKHLIECAKNNITINFNEKIRPTEEKEATNLVNEQFMQIAIPNSTACETHEQLALNIEDDITKMAKELNSNQHNIDEQQQMETEVQQITEVVNELVVVPDVNKKNSERLKKLKKLKLVNIKRRQGKPRTTKKLDKYKYSPKPFLKKKSHEKNRMFLSWTTGKEKSHYLLLNQQKADQKHLTHASQMSTAVLEDDVQSVLQSFQNLFTEEGWKQLMTNIHERNQTTLEYICPTCRKPEGTKKEPWIFCESCQLWHHYSCQAIKKKPQSSNYTCTICRKSK